MTMFHHDARNFQEAKSEAATAMRDKLGKEIEVARTKGAIAIEKILTELPRDRYRMMSSTSFDLADDNALIVNYRGDEPETIHGFALNKICETIGVPKDVVVRLLQKRDVQLNDNWGPELVLDILNQHFKHAVPSQERRMIRSVKAQTRGFLSDSYARLHPGKLVETFATECSRYGLVPYGGHAGDTKFVIRAVYNRVLEPIKDEVIGIGVTFKESPYGDGSTDLGIQIERMWCTNKAICASELRKVHLGSRAALDDSDSDAVYELATNSMCVEMRRALRDMLSPDAIELLTDGIKKAHETKVTHTQFEAFLKKHLSKTDVETVKEKYRSTDISDLPAGDSWWRASNAISWFANQRSEADEVYDLQKLAGAALELGSKAKG